MIRINLLPVEEAQRAAGRRQQLAIGSFVVGVAVGLLVLAHGWQSLRSASARHQLTRLTEQIKEIEGPYADSLRLEQQKQELREKLRVIGQLEARKVGPVRILAQVQCQLFSQHRAHVPATGQYFSQGLDQFFGCALLIHVT